MPHSLNQPLHQLVRTPLSFEPTPLPLTPDIGTPTAPAPEIHPATITVGTETVNVTVAEGRGGAPTMAIATETKGAYYIQNGNEWLKVDPAHIEATWPQEVKDKIPTLLSADAAGDRAAADAAPDTEWHTDSDYLTKEILQVLKASGTDVSQFSVEGKTPEEAMKIKDSLFNTWITWNEQQGITLTSAPESLIAAVVSYGPNYTVYPHYGTEPGNEKMTFGWNALGSGPPGYLEGLVGGNKKDVSMRGETFTIYVANSSLGIDGKHRVLLHRLGYSSDNPVDVVGLENNRNALTVLIPTGSTTVAGDLCLTPLVVGQKPDAASCEVGQPVSFYMAGQMIGHTSIRRYPASLISYDSNFPQKLMDNPGAQVRASGETDHFYWLDGIPVAAGFYSTAFK